MGKNKKDKSKKANFDNLTTAPVEGADAVASSASQELNRKEYEKELERVHVELVQLQEWVKREKKKICTRESLEVADVRPLKGLRWGRGRGTHIRKECQVRGVAVSTPEQRLEMFKLTSGLPLPIKLGIARMGGGESFADGRLLAGQCRGRPARVLRQGSD